MYLKRLLILIAINFAYAVDFRFPRSLMLDQFEIQRNDDCTRTGFMCDSCEDVVFCFQLPNGNWIKEPAGSCGDDLTCNDGACSAIPTFECDPTLGRYRFICNQVGMFPHAFDCKTYYQCLRGNNVINPNPVELHCPSNFSYDPLTTLCRHKLPNDACTRPLLQPCRSVGQSGPIPGNPSMYYACLPLETPEGRLQFPQVFYCEGNDEFHDGACRETTPEGIDDGECTAVGNFYDPDDCRNYFECGEVGEEPEEETCDDGLRFDGRTEECIPFTCH